MDSAQRPSRWTVILAFGLVYLFWGSTYLAIDIAVQTIPPALMCGCASPSPESVMLAVCAATGRRNLYSPKQIVLAAVVGLLAADGREPHALLRGARCRLRTRCAHHRHHAILVSRARFLAARRSSYLETRESRALRSDLGLFVLVWPELRRPGPWARRELWASISLIGGSSAGLWVRSSRKTMAIRHGRFQLHRMAGPRRGSRKLPLCGVERRLHHVTWTPAA